MAGWRLMGWPRECCPTSKNWDYQDRSLDQCLPVVFHCCATLVLILIILELTIIIADNILGGV